MKLRVGMGFDVHPLEEGRNFYLGGVLLPGATKVPLDIPTQMS